MVGAGGGAGAGAGGGAGWGLWSMVWQMGLMAMIVYSALVVPFELAFGMQPNLEHASLIADFIFILDIAVVFHTKIEIVLNNEPVVLGQRDIIAR
jgi:hypothetical protein